MIIGPSLGLDPTMSIKRTKREFSIKLHNFLNQISFRLSKGPDMEMWMVRKYNIFEAG